MTNKNTDILAFPDRESLKNIVADTLKLAQDKGATQAEAGLAVSQGIIGRNPHARGGNNRASAG